MASLIQSAPTSKSSANRRTAPRSGVKTDPSSLGPEGRAGHCGRECHRVKPAPAGTRTALTASRSVWLPSKSNEARNFSKFPGQHAMAGPAAWPARAGSTVLHSGHQSEGSRTPPMQRRWERCIRPRGRPARRRPIHRRRQAGGDVPRRSKWRSPIQSS